MGRRTITIAALAGTLALAACGDEGSPNGASAPTAEAPPAASEGGGSAPKRERDKPDRPAPEPGLELTTASSPFGEVLFDEKDRAIYLFDAEQSDSPECYGDCAVAWPPVLTEGEPQAGGAVRASLLGTTKRDDGKTQVTYDGHPLYYYVDDPPGQILCHNVEEFGGLWLVIRPDGAPA